MKRVLIALAMLLAAPLAARAQAGTIILTTPPPPGGLICYNHMVYSFSMTYPFGGYVYSPGGSPCTGPNGSAYTGGGGASGSNPRSAVAGSPNSVQFTSLQTALNLDDVDVEGDARFADSGDSDTIGGSAGYYNASGADGEDLEGRYERNWRPFEGSRTRAIVNLPVAVDVSNQGGQDVRGLIEGGFEIPVRPNWSVTPRAGIGGAVGASAFGGDGVLGTLSLGSRYRFPQVSRGDLVIGNLVSYTGESVAGTQNAAFRNGVAYQWPLKQMMFGRQVSARISYVNTYIAGDYVPYRVYNEVAVNFGVRMREQDVRSRFELLRFGLLYTNADNYNAVTLTAGYRF